MNLYGLSAISNVNRARKQIGTGGFLASSTGGGGNQYPGTYGGSAAGLLPGGRISVSPSNTGQPRSLPGVDFPVVGYPETGWSSGQGNPYGNMIPGMSPAPGGPQVITTQNIPPNDASQLPMNTWYSNDIPNGGGAGEFYGGVYPRPPAPYPAPDMNIPPNEDVSPTPVDTFYGSTAFNGPTRRTGGFGAGYPDLSGAPPVTVNAPYGTASNPYPIPGYGGLPSNYGGGQSWQSNASRGGGFSGFAANAASNLGFGGGLTSGGGGGWQTISGIPEGLGSISWAQALGGGQQKQIL